MFAKPSARLLRTDSPAPATSGASTFSFGDASRHGAAKSVSLCVTRCWISWPRSMIGFSSGSCAASSEPAAPERGDLSLSQSRCAQATASMAVGSVKLPAEMLNFLKPPRVSSMASCACAPSFLRLAASSSKASSASSRCSRRSASCSACSTRSQCSRSASSAAEGISARASAASAWAMAAACSAEDGGSGVGGGASGRAGEAAGACSAC
mmetsp:Transcript_43971/g.113615  ORF Transcript_43971/g.113615 Transcript_43971/m.113615 type:complete len:210 (-) Transcript_43971:403-1032(-)